MDWAFIFGVVAGVFGTVVAAKVYPKFKERFKK